MRPSIKNYFASWKKTTLFLLLVLGLGTLTVVEEYTSFEKIATLQNQKKLVNFITDIGREDLEFASIQYRGKSTMLHYEHERLLNLNSYDIMGQYLLGQSMAYNNDLEQLKLLALEFTDSAEIWYEENEKNLQEREEKMLSARENILAHINRMIEINISYDHEKFQIQSGLIYFAMLLLFFIFLTNLKHFSAIRKDIESLYIVEAGAEPHTIITDEIEIVAKRMNRKPQTSDNPALIDPITEINNYKGLLQAYANKKGSKDRAYVAVCVFEIDNFSEIDKQYPKSFTQSVLKRTAFNLHVYEQPTDIIARTDYSQFAVVFSRNTREQVLKETQDIMRSFDEARFKVPNGESIQLTLSAGVVPKLGKSTIDEVVEQAREVLSAAKEKGPNTLLESKDIMH